MNTVNRIRVRCEADRGLFNDEFLITVKTDTGIRRFFVDKSFFSPDADKTALPSSGYVEAMVLDQENEKYLVSITSGESADYSATRFWLNAGEVAGQEA